MPSLNKVTLIGHLGRDPEMKFTPSGKPVASFSVAVSNRYQQNGEWKEETQWFNIVTWNKTAEFCNQFLSKGMLVYVEGSVKLKEWEGKDGVKKANMEITASSVKSLEKKTEAEATEDTKEVMW